MSISTNSFTDVGRGSPLPLASVAVDDGILVIECSSVLLEDVVFAAGRVPHADAFRDKRIRIMYTDLRTMLWHCSFTVKEQTCNLAHKKQSA